MTAAREWPAIHLSKKLSRATVLLIAITEAAADATIAIVRRDRAIRTALAEGSLSAEMIAATTGMTVEQVMTRPEPIAPRISDAWRGETPYDDTYDLQYAIYREIKGLAVRDLRLILALSQGLQS